MSKKKNKEFKEKYKTNPVRQDALAKFNESNQISLSKKTREYMCQFLAVIGLELENRFPQIQIEDGKFKLFGREKSKKSVSTKKKINIKEYDKNYKQAIKEGNSSFQSEIRPIFDYYAFKLVCTKVDDIDEILETVKKDFSASSDKFQVLKYKVSDVTEYAKLADSTTKFAEKASLVNMKNITYKEYYDLLGQCYSLLDDLTYDECTDEKEHYSKKLQKINGKLEELEATNTSDITIPSPSYKKYHKKLKKALKEINNKATDKLDLAIGDIIIYDILHTSKYVKYLGVRCSRDKSRTKNKRRPNGYVANFYSLDMPNGMTSELQVQSAYRYEYGEHGPAAHNKMENGVKKRDFLQTPESEKKKDYKDWEKEQFESLPRYFTYKGVGTVHIYNAFDNFRRYYDCEKPSKVRKYIQYIASHNIDLLETQFKRFKLGTPSVLDDDNER